ncbi:thioesterase domain-containing protein [Streptomyces sp. NPDC020807]|uniref:thioesterase II family protein n=1 Tax=Streptomyces sp. NPDC020807 TaxID=3155119 RepID=UPI0034084D18
MTTALSRWTAANGRPRGGATDTDDRPPGGTTAAGPAPVPAARPTSVPAARPAPDRPAAIGPGRPAAKPLAGAAGSGGAGDRVPLRAGRPRVEGDWLLVPAPQAHRPYRLFCFPHAGGDATAYTPLARALAPTAEVWALRPPARGGRGRHPMPADFDRLVAAVVEAIGPHLTGAADGRFGFYGQSFGALLAYEVARALPAHRRPDLVVAVGAPAPGEWSGRRTKDLDAAELLRLTGLDELVLADPDLTERALAAIRVDLAVSGTYRHRPHAPIGSDLLALAGAADPMLATCGLTGWAGHTRGAFGHRVVPGGHLLATVDRPGPVELLTSLIRSRVASEEFSC